MPELPAESALCIHLLGRFEVRAGEQVVIDRTWSRRKAKVLVKLLALQKGHVIHREQVLDALWPDLDPAAAANQLHKNLHYLRTALSEHRLPPSTVAVVADMVSLAPNTWVDVEAFRSQAQHARATRSEPSAYERAIALYGGDLLPEDIYEDWAAPHREELRSLWLALLSELGQLYEARGQLDLAAERLRALLQADPPQEEAHRSLMRLYAQAGSRHRALRQYQVCRATMQRELGVEPSEETEELYQALLAGHFAAEGRTEGIGGRRDSPSPALSVPPSRQPPPLYGREQELQQVEEALESALTNRGQTLFISGVAGIGKSHCAQHVVASAEKRGALALSGRSYELEATVAYQPIRDMLRQVVHQVGDGPITQHLYLSLHLKRLLPHEDAGVSPSADPALLQMELFSEVSRVFGALADERPESGGLVLFFDDLHAADEASLRLVHFLSRQVGQHRVLLLATYRADETTPGRPFAALLGSVRRERLAREVALGPLSEAAMGRVIEQLFGGQPVEPELTREIVRYAEGNPLFASEIVHTLRDEGWVNFADGRWQRQAEGTAPVPGAIQELLDRRLQRMPDETRQVLQTASVLGRTFDYALLRDTLQLPERTVLDALDDAIAGYIVEEATDGYRFRHNLLREAIYRRLTRARRQQLHRTVASALADGSRAAGGSETEALAYHFAESDEPWRAVPHLQAAARRAASVFANEQAARLYEQALTIIRDHGARAGASQHASVLEELGDLKSRAGEIETSVGLYEQALALYSAAGDGQAAIHVRGKAALGHITRGDVEGATAHLQATLHEMSDRSPQNVVSRTYYLLAQLHWHNAQHHEALEAAEKALLAAESSGDVGQRAQAYEVMALACHSLGDWQKGVEYELRRQALGVEGFDIDEAFDAHL